MNKGNYASWAGYSVLYDEGKTGFDLKCQGKMHAVKNLKIDRIYCDGKYIGSINTFNKCVYQNGRIGDDSSYLLVKYLQGSELVKAISIKFILGNDGIEISVSGPKNCSFEISGELNWGNGKTEDVYPMSSDAKDEVLRAAVGPASSNHDDILFDRITDTALSLTKMKNIRIKYDWNRKKYVFNATSGNKPSERKLKISVINGLLTNQYHINYSPINKQRIFKKPPAGWMTWYAVKFNACEEKVLKNAKWMSENLKEYGAECIWVDWEWCHKDMTGSRDDGCDCFNPDKEKYPHGLKYISDKIKEMGLVPALWIGFTNDSNENEYIKDNPEIILVDEKRWPGRYFFDFSHPKYLNEFLPKAIENVHKWGYEAVKYDVLPLSMMLHEQYHSNMYNSNLTTKEAFRGMVKKARRELGEKCYMLSCAAGNDQDVLWGADIFDSARVGDDIFKWGDFLKQGVGKIIRYYPLHNNVLYTDNDNVVMREEFNDINQAASRIYFVSMLGLPLTFGDEFDALDDKRIGFIKECLPILETHPMNVYRNEKKRDVLKINLSICKPWENYNVVNVFNILSQKSTATVDLLSDLGLDDKEYIIYNYTDDKFEGITNKSFKAELEKCESKIFSIREKLNRPQIISTSRHISQGAAEIKNMEWNSESSELLINAELIKDAPYTITLYVPDGFKATDDLIKVQNNVYKRTITPNESKETEIRIIFK